MEHWAEIIGWPYEVSDAGRVRRSQPGPATRPGFVLKPYATERGYLRIQLSRDNAPRRFMVHRLVAEAFVPNPEGKRFVNHRNGDPTDNRAENLEWVTQRENQLHAYDRGLQAAGSGHGRAKLTEEQVREIRDRHAAGETQTALAQEYPVNQSMISKIVRGQFWQRTAPSAEEE